jgi:hypothetical protein
MINFDYLESNISELSKDFKNAVPFEHIVIDNFCYSEKLADSIQLIPDVNQGGGNKSRDFIFAKNKFEKSMFHELHPNFKILKSELLSDRFQKFLFNLTGEEIFVDPSFHGGGLHQGGKDSFLNMHVDFNYHPLNRNWFRNVNILLYLNEDWKKEYRGELKLRDGRNKGSSPNLIEPLFNRAVIMFTRDYTFHGYDKINFPDGHYRRSIAAYGYTIQEPTEEARTTVWYPENEGLIKKFLGKHMSKIIKYKSRVLGSGTNKNK